MKFTFLSSDDLVQESNRYHCVVLALSTLTEIGNPDENTLFTVIGAKKNALAVCLFKSLGGKDRGTAANVL